MSHLVRTRFTATIIVIAVALGACASTAPTEVLGQTERFGDSTGLVSPDMGGIGSVEAALNQRRSRREFTDAQLSMETIGQLLWAGQGVTNSKGNRTAPSAGARYPIELYVLTADQLFHYLPDGHRLEQRSDTRTLATLADAAFGQEFISTAPAVVIITGVPARTQVEYGAVASELVVKESGHVAQNILLQATALDLASVPVAGIDPDAVGRLLALPPGEEVEYLIPVGHPS